jgi:hypothetical protein
VKKQQRTLGKGEGLDKNSVFEIHKHAIRSTDDSSRPYKTLLPVDTTPEDLGTIEGNDFPGVEHHILSCGWISSPALFFVPYAKLPEATDQDIFTTCQGIFNQFQERFDEF